METGREVDAAPGFETMEFESLFAFVQKPLLHLAMLRPVYLF
jgi:hypothetical protein